VDFACFLKLGSGYLNVSFCVFGMLYFLFVVLSSVVSTSCVKRHVVEKTCFVSSGM